MVLKIAYWATTIIAAAMLLLDLIYLTGSAQMVAGFNHLGYPQHLRVVLGAARPAAGVVLLLPGLRLLKEWAYAGVSFAWSMAFLAHWLAGRAPGPVGRLLSDQAGEPRSGPNDGAGRPNRRLNAQRRK